MAKTEEAECKDDELVNISVRDMTIQEKSLLDSCKDDQCISNTHVWHVEKDVPAQCSNFAKLNVIEIAVGGDHLLLLSHDKKVYSQGSNNYGQLGLGDTLSREGEPSLVSALNDLDIVHIFCGARHSAALCQNGMLYTWGDSRKGQCGLGEKRLFLMPTKVHFSRLRNTNDPSARDISPKVKNVGCGDAFTTIIDTRGCVWCCGSGDVIGSIDSLEGVAVKPQLVKKLRYKKAISLSCGEFHCVVITQDDFEESHFNLSTPDYRTVSVSSSYYAELQSPANDRLPKIPFLKSTFYSSKNDEEDQDQVRRSMRRSHSDPELDVYSSRIKASDPSFFVSELDLRKFSRYNTLKETNRNLALHGLSTYQERTVLSSENDSTLTSPDRESLGSSRYYSAHDMLFRDNVDERISTSSSTLHASTSTIDANDDDAELFKGKKSIFDDVTSSKSSLMRRQIGLSQRSISNLVGKSGIALLQLTGEEGEESFSNGACTEVWSWGKNCYGQLGLTDLNDRLEPTLIEKLRGKCVIQVAAGSDHTIALTAHGHVYTWGDNTFGQIAHSKNLISTPKKVKVLVGVHIWDIAAGRNFTLLLGDVSRSKTEVYFCGDVDKQRNRSISQPIIKIPSNSKKRNDSWWRLSRRSKKRIEKSMTVDIQVRKLIHFQNDELVRSVCANDICFGCLTERPDQSGILAPIYKFARAERLFYQQLTIIQKAVIEPLIQTESWSHITKFVGGEALTPLIDSFVDLMNATSSVLSQLTDIIRLGLSVKELFSFLFSDSFRAVYERYSTCYADALAVGHLHSCNKPASSIISKIKVITKDLEKHLSLSPVSFENLMKAPLTRSHVYSDIAKQILSHYKNLSEEEQLREVLSRWSTFHEMSTKQLKLAQSTSQYWDEFHKKLTEALKDPKRRVLKSSRNDPLNLARASRLSNHSYILCNDVFVHVQFNRNFQVFPLVTLWADSVNDTSQIHNAIRITSPEESFVLSAGTPDGKISWLKDLNQAIASCLSACSSHSLNVDTVNASTGLLTAAIAREASYVYVNHLKYRYAHYKGMWLAGVPHGRGKMSWDDETLYSGEFVHGLFHGFGQMRWPASHLNPIEKNYEGEWIEGQMFGYGRMRYGSTEEYVGHFKDGVRDGHGMLKTSLNKSSLETIYIGDWVNDVRQGYGVLDYIIRGEKYMGMWWNDQRQGHGVVVTVDGVYYEGQFVQNRLVGRGLLLSDDESCYEGEFTADMLLSGKGLLTLPNGDFIDGTFYGTWGESIKVNGVLNKFTNPLRCSDITGGRSNLLESTNFAIDAHMKWKSLFDECFAALGCHNNTQEDPEAAWRCATNAVLKYSSTAHAPKKFDLELIQQKKNSFVENMKMAGNLKSLQTFLSKTLDTIGHPLNLLVEGLVDVYRATYVGVGAHRRLLPHAVAEAKSYVTRVFNVLRVLFPDLHDEEFVLLSSDVIDGVIEAPINSITLLHPLLLPRLYPPLFTLYALHTEKSDALYTEKLYYLNKRADVALMSFLGVKRSFWLISEEFISSDKTLTGDDRPYIPAINCLERISTTYSPMGKIEIIRRTFASIHDAIDQCYRGKKQQILAMDDLFPLFQYIVIRARVPHLGSEIKFIEDLVESSVLVGEAGHMVTTLSACYFQIQKERDRD